MSICRSDSKEFLFAAKIGDAQKVQNMISRVNVNITTKCGDTALSLAATHGQNQVTEILLKSNKIKVNKKTFMDNLP